MRERCVCVSIGGERGLGDVPRPTETRIDLDDAVLPPRRVERKLDVTLTNDAKMPDNLEGSRPKHVILVVRERLRRRDDDGVSGMDAQRVEVLSKTKRVITGVAIADENALPPCYTQ